MSEPHDALMGRIEAQRRLLLWLFANFEFERATLEKLLRDMDEPYPPADHQEDPGAVPTAAFAGFAAHAAEMRLLLEPVRHRLADLNDI
ncbi:hypothetical protein [Rhizobium sp. EC-SD404]|uniref:hypothetical protein n=1 Tax=Rhizobium sp. EC-SD404 TaxID=2038389 RepID=UPI001260039F|nr:hypothetical protein [Rhizobium sp. EC-SD404]